MGKNGTPSEGSAGKRKKGGEGAEKGSAPLPKVGAKDSSGNPKTMRPQKDGSGAKPPLKKKKKRESTATIEGNGGALRDGEGTAARKAGDFFQRTSEEIAEQWYSGAHAQWGARSSGDDAAGFHAYCEIHPITSDPEDKKSEKERALAQKKKWKKLTTEQQDRYILRAYIDNHPRAVPPMHLRDPQDEEPSSLPSSKKPNKRQRKSKSKEGKAGGAKPNQKKQEGEISVEQDQETVPDFWPSDSRILDVLSREEVLPANGQEWINANLSCTDSREVASKWLLPADQDWREATKRASLFKANNKNPPTSGRGLRVHQVGARIALQSPTHYHVALKGILALFGPWILKEGKDALGDVEFKEAGIEEQIEDLLARRDVRLECMAREARTKSKMGIPSGGRKLLRSRVALLGQKLAEARIRQSGLNPRSAKQYESSLEKDVREIQRYEDFESFLKGLKAKRKHSASSSGSEEDSSSGEDRSPSAEELADKQDEPSGRGTSQGEESSSSSGWSLLLPKKKQPPPPASPPGEDWTRSSTSAPAPRLLSWRAHTAASIFHKDGVPLGILHPEIDDLAPEDGRYKCLTTGRPISKEAFFKRQRRAEKEREALSDSRKRAEGMERARAAHELATEERDSRRRLRDEEEERRAERHSARDLISKESRRAALRLDCYARAVEAAGKSGTKAEKLDFYAKVLEEGGGDLLNFSAPGTGRYTEKLELLVGIVLSATTAVGVANSRARELGKARASLETALEDALDAGDQGEDDEEEALAFMKGLQESLEQATKDAKWILEQRNRAMSSGPREGGPSSEDLGESTTDDERAESTHSGEEEATAMNNRILMDPGIPELQPTHIHFEKVYRQYVQDVTLKYGILTGWLTMFTAIEERATSNVNSKWKSGPGSNIISAIIGGSSGQIIHEDRGLISDFIDRYKQLLADPSNHLLPAAHLAHAERLLYLNTRNDAGVYTVTELIKQMWTWDQETFTPPAAPYTDLQSGRGLDSSGQGAAQRRRKAAVQKMTASYDEDFEAGYEDEDYGAATGPAEGEGVAWATMGLRKLWQMLNQVEEVVAQEPRVGDVVTVAEAEEVVVPEVEREEADLPEAAPEEADVVVPPQGAVDGVVQPKEAVVEEPGLRNVDAEAGHLEQTCAVLKESHQTPQPHQALLEEINIRPCRFTYR
ncbi:hypothetical protein T484DRAFT_1848192 [Baffinella frigidus]|nr:hypothetical protein T484DRAFT_1848192 [Cryptophyta sp. CCMP2293]